MRSSRLTLALDSGAVALPASGLIGVFRPNAGDDLSALPQDRVTVIQGFKPDHDAFAAQGYSVLTEGAVRYAGALVCLPRSKAEARALIAAAAAQVGHGGPVIVDGQKTDGIDAMYRDIRDRVATTPPLSKAHGKMFAFAAGPDFADWQGGNTVIEGGFVTRPGVFSADAPDRGSALLAAALPAKLAARVVDLGAGWGYLSRAVLARDGVKRLDLVEAESDALACARLNVIDERAQFHWADALTWRAEGVIDTVVCNPPFHNSRAADPGLGASFIRAGAALLHPGGVLWLVANRHLPYATVLAETFRDVEEVGGDGAFRIIRAARPIRARR